MEQHILVAPILCSSDDTDNIYEHYPRNMPFAMKDGDVVNVWFYLGICPTTSKKIVHVTKLVHYTSNEDIVEKDRIKSITKTLGDWFNTANGDGLTSS